MEHTSLAIGSGPTSSVRLAYTGNELKAFLSKDNVKLTGSGTVPASAGLSTVTLAQKVTIKAKLDLNLRIGG